MKTRQTFIRIIALFAIALFSLTACSPAGTEPAKEVIQNFKKAVTDIKTVDMALVFEMDGTDTTDTVNFDLNADVKLDRRDNVDRKADVDVDVDGKMVAGGKSLDGALKLTIRTVGKEFYFNLDKFESNDPNTEEFKTLFKPYEKKWQHLASDFVPQSIKDLQEKDEETLKKEKQLMDLFVSTQLLDVTKEYGVESLNGKKVYHYEVKLNKVGLKDFIQKASSINGKEMTTAELDEAVTFADSITKMEMWIGVKDYYLYKGIVGLSGSDPEKNVTSNISLTYTANSYNQDPKITAPSSYEEFNPLALLMGMQMGAGALPGATTDTTDSSTSSADSSDITTTTGTETTTTTAE